MNLSTHQDQVVVPLFNSLNWSPWVSTWRKAIKCCTMGKPSTIAVKNLVDTKPLSIKQRSWVISSSFAFSTQTITVVIFFSKLLGVHFDKTRPQQTFWPVDPLCTWELARWKEAQRTWSSLYKGMLSYKAWLECIHCVAISWFLFSSHDMIWYDWYTWKTWLRK